MLSMYIINKNNVRVIAFAALIMLFILPSAVSAITYDLKAEATTVTLPDGATVPMWGFGLVGGDVSIPGPVLTVPPGDSLTVNLTNNLPVPVSIVIPGQIAAMVPDRVAGRAVSFTHQTPPTQVGVYTWNTIKSGSYLYHSGSHVAVQVPMGLYGAMTSDAVAGEVYAGHAYDNDIHVFYSEIDPDLNNAVAADNFGPGKAMTSTIHFSAKYYLVNGQAFPDAGVLLPMFDSAQSTLIRFFNAGNNTRVPLLQGQYLHFIAEDGNLYPYAKDQYSVIFPAGKTMDALVTGLQCGTYPLYDRRLGLTNFMQGKGGMLTYLHITDAGSPAPGVVGNLMVTKQAPASMNITWTDSVDGDFYKVYWSTNPASLTNVLGGTVSGDVGLTVPLPSDNLVFYKVAALGCGGEGSL